MTSFLEIRCQNCGCCQTWLDWPTFNLTQLLFLAHTNIYNSDLFPWDTVWTLPQNCGCCQTWLVWPTFNLTQLLFLAHTNIYNSDLFPWDTVWTLPQTYGSCQAKRDEVIVSWRPVACNPSLPLRQGLDSVLSLEGPLETGTPSRGTISSDLQTTNIICPLY